MLKEENIKKNELKAVTSIKEELKSCDICGATDTVIINERQPWSKTVLIRGKDPEGNNKTFHKTDVMCKSCGLIYKNPMLTKESLVEFYKEDYTKLYEPNNVNSITGQAIAYRVLNIIQILDWLKEIDYDVKGKKIVEIGSGFGSLLYVLKSMGADVYGIEAGARPAEISEKLFGIKPWVASFDDFWDISQGGPKDFYMKNADLVIISNTLEHFYSPKEVLIKARKMLSEDGQILIEVPDMFYPYPLINTDAFLSSAHNYTFNLDTIDRLASKCNLALRHIGTGHKRSLLFMLNKTDKEGCYTPPPLDAPDQIKRIKFLYSEYNEFCDFIKGGSPKAVYKELKKPDGLASLFNQFPHFSNIILIIYMDYLLNSGKFKECVDLAKTDIGSYSPCQSEDLHYCEGVYFFLISLAYRNIGDFKFAKYAMEKSSSMFPGFNKYNFIKHIHMDGILPETSFAPYIWHMCYEALKDMR